MTVATPTMPARRKGRYALAAALLGVAVWTGSWFVANPWVTESAALVLALAALVLGALGWRSASAKAAVGIVVGIVGLYVLVASTATFQ